MNTNTNTITKRVNITPTMRATLEQLGAEIVEIDGDKLTIDEETAQELENVTRCSCGAAGGFGGFIYYYETWEFFRKNRAEIVKHLQEMADAIGDGCAVDLVRGFNCFKDDKPSADEIGRLLWGELPEKWEDASDIDEHYIYNACALFCLEETANAWADGEEIEENEENESEEA